LRAASRSSAASRLSIDERDKLRVDRLADKLGEHRPAGGDELGDLRLDVVLDLHGHDAHPDTGRRRFARADRRFSRTAPGTARTRINRTYRTSCLAQPCGFLSTPRR
jgi:hypothetical protein